MATALWLLSPTRRVQGAGRRGIVRTATSGSKGVKPTIPVASTVAAAGLRLARIAAGLHEEQKIVWSLFGSRLRFGAALQGAGSGTVLMDILGGAAHQSSIMVTELW
jgi:hypothetical protein